MTIKELLLETIVSAGKILVESNNAHYLVSEKEGVNNLVTEIDKKSEAYIINRIKTEFPSHSILSEEIGVLETSSDYKWIIDPIDGTINFVHHIPMCCVSIGIEKEGVLIMGAVYNPFVNELFFAEKGGGAFLNDKKIKVSKQEKIEKSCIATGFPYKYINQPNGPLEVFATLIRKGIPMRRLGSAAIDLCYVASGKFDAFYEHLLYPWDIAAGVLIVSEAGGIVSNFNTKGICDIYTHSLIASNTHIYHSLLSIILEQK